MGLLGSLSLDVGGSDHLAPFLSFVGQTPPLIAGSARSLRHPGPPSLFDDLPIKASSSLNVTGATFYSAPGSYTWLGRLRAPFFRR
jgi:hypothetical protein